MLLNTADAVHLGGNPEADRVYLGSNLVFQKEIGSPATEHSVFGVNAPGVLTSHNDAALNSWIAQQYYVTTATALTVVGARIYVPSDSSMIGLGGFIGLARRPVASGGIWLEGQGPAPNQSVFEGNGAKTEFTASLVAGWNEFHYSTAYSLLPGDGLVIGYTVDNGKYYLYNNGMNNTRYDDVDGVGFALAEATGNQGTPNRCIYNGGFTQSRWYGLDILVTEA